MFIGINLSQSDDGVARQDQRTCVGHKASFKIGRPRVPDLQGVLTHQLNIFRKTGTALTQSKTGRVTYLGSVHPKSSCGYRHHTCIRHKHHVKNTSEQFNLNRLKSESLFKGNTNKTPTSVVPVHTQQTNALW